MPNVLDSILWPSFLLVVPQALPQRLQNIRWVCRKAAHEQTVSIHVLFSSSYCCQVWNALWPVSTRAHLASRLVAWKSGMREGVYSWLDAASASSTWVPKGMAFCQCRAACSGTAHSISVLAFGQGATVAVSARKLLGSSSKKKKTLKNLHLKWSQ